MSLESSLSKPLHRRIARWFRNAFLMLVALLGLVLWQLDRELPSFARVRLERALSQGIFSYRFDHASANLFHGITIRNVRVHLKRTLGPALITIGELRLRGRRYGDRPFYTWVKTIEAEDFVCRPFFDLPESERGGVDLGKYLGHCTIEHDWFSDPVRVSLRNADIFAVKCGQVNFRISAKTNLVTMADIRADIRSRGFDETLSGWATFSPSPCEIRSRLHGTLTPEVLEGLIDFLEGDTANQIARRTDNYSSPLQVSGEILWRSSPTAGVSAEQDFRASVQGGGLTYRGVPLRSLKFGLQWVSAPHDAGRERRLSIGPIDFGFENGSASVLAVWHPSTHATEIQADGNARPEDLAQIVWGRIPSILTNFTFQTLPNITARGRVMPDGMDEKTFVAGSAAVASATARGVPLEDVSFDFSVHGDETLDFTNIAARVFNGSLGGYVRVADYDTAPDIDLAFTVHDADCHLVRRHFAGNDLEGRGTVDLDIALRGSADPEHLDALAGSSTLRIRGGNIFRIPLFAGLTDFIGRNVPGVDLLLMQSDANAMCTLANGLVAIELIEVSGNLFSLVASGRCRINKDGFPVDMLAQLRFFHSQSLIGKLARLVTLPVSKMMEFRVTGPVNNANWDYIGLIDRIKSIFWSREDATDPDVPPDAFRDAAEEGYQ